MIDKTTLSAEQRLFLEGLTAAGVPADETAFRGQMQTLADDAALPIANPSKYSAFWNFVQSAIAAPLKLIITALVKTEIPGFYVQTASGERLDMHAAAVGLSRKAATAMTCNITFFRAAGAVGAVEIPVGTVVRSPAINGNVYRLATTADAEIPADAESLIVPCVAVGTGENYNLAAGYYRYLDSDVPRIGEVESPSGYLLTPGADEETDEELRLRVRDCFLAVSDWHTDAKYRAMIAATAGIRPDRIFFTAPTAAAPGVANCYIIFEAGDDPDQTLAELNAYINDKGHHGHGDRIICQTIPKSAQTITAVCRFSATAADTAARLDEIGDLIQCAFWGNSDYADVVTRAEPYSVFSFSQLASEIHAAVPELTSIVFNLSEIQSDLSLPTIDTLTVSEAN